MADPVGQGPSVADVACDDDVHLRRVAQQQVLARVVRHHAVGLRVQGHRGGAERVHVGGQNLRRARHQRGDGHDPRAGCEVQHAAARHLFGVVQQVARQRLTAGPGEGPEGRVHAGLLQDLFRRAPDRLDLGGEVELKLWRVRGPLQPRVLQDESPVIDDHPALAGSPPNASAHCGESSLWKAL